MGIGFLKGFADKLKTHGKGILKNVKISLMNETVKFKSYFILFLQTLKELCYS